MTEKMFRFNSSENSDVLFRGANNNNNNKLEFDVIAGCLDYKRQKPVPVGDYYHTDDCTICLCHSTQKMCKQIYCAPPTNCDGFIKKDPLHCCDVCVPNTVERPADESSLNMKFGALTVTLFLIVSLILFTFHRFRRKRLLITLRRLRGLRRQDTSFSFSVGGRDSADGNVQQTVLSTADGVRSGLQIVEAPPSYASAVTLPRPSTTLPVVADLASRRLHNVTFGEPPPPYPAPVVSETLSTSSVNNARRGVLSSVVNALTTIRRHRNVANNANNESNSSTELHVNSTIVDGSRRRSSDSREYFTDDASGIGTASSLSVSRDSIDSSSSSDAESSSSCCCSQCESSLSRDEDDLDECSLSSNDVRPRSEMSMIRVVNNYRQSTADPVVNVINEINSIESPEITTQSTAVSARQRLCDSCQMALGVDSEHAELRNGTVISQENRVAKRKNMCKRKLKKLISRRKKKTNPVSAAAASASANASESAQNSIPASRAKKQRRKCRRNNAAVVGTVCENSTVANNPVASGSSVVPNELMTSV